jgi:hypothetical protein
MNDEGPALTMSGGLVGLKLRWLRASRTPGLLLQMMGVLIRGMAALLIAGAHPALGQAPAAQPSARSPAEVAKEQRWAAERNQAILAAERGEAWGYRALLRIALDSYSAEESEVAGEKLACLAYKDVARWIKALAGEDSNRTAGFIKSHRLQPPVPWPGSCVKSNTDYEKTIMTGARALKGSAQEQALAQMIVSYFKMNPVVKGAPDSAK